MRDAQSATQPVTQSATQSVTHLALVGPTASGKSALAFEIARTHGDIEIVSIDSMQVYRGMDIGTAKASVAERAEIPHHQIDVVDPTDDYSVARFQTEARAAVAAIAARGNRALLVGGTGLYVRAVIDDYCFAGEDPVARAELTERVATPDGLRAAYAELEARDPAAAGRIEPDNVRRIVRALEVMGITGRPFSESRLVPGGPTVFPVAIAGVWLTRAELADRITQRIEVMREGGLVEEVDALLRQGELSRSAAQAIGYREIIDARAGRLTIDEAFTEMVRRTRSFARRQRMWFRRDPRIVWWGALDSPSAILPGLLAAWAQ